MLFVAFPPLLARLLVGARELAKRGRPASWKWSGALIAALALLLVAALFVDVPALALEHVARADGTVDLVAGDRRGHAVGRVRAC